MSEVLSMSIENRLLKLEEIWNSFDDIVLKSPSWHEDILKERKKKYENNKMKFVSLTELKKKYSEV